MYMCEDCAFVNEFSPTMRYVYAVEVRSDPSREAYWTTVAIYEDEQLAGASVKAEAKVMERPEEDYRVSKWVLE